MKATRYLLILTTILVLALSAGCTRSYFFNFEKEADLARLDGDFYVYENPDGSYFLSSNGLFVQNCWLGVPHLYSGNFTVTIDFELDVSDTSTAQIGLHLSTQAGLWGADWTGGIDLNGLGEVPNGHYYTYYDPGSGNVYIETGEPITAAIATDGQNVVKIVKEANHVDFMLNGVTIGLGMDIIGSSSDMFCPHFYACQSTSVVAVLFESIRIDYEGERVLLP